MDKSQIIEQNDLLRRKLIEHLSQFVLEHRFDLFQRVLSKRTRYVTVVLEDIFQSQNASAVLRTCDCMGVQDVHVIENRNRFKIDSEVDMGASKWLTIHRYSGDDDVTAKALTAMKRKGYRIVATSPHVNDCEVGNFDISRGRFALIFGTELTGLSSQAMNLADDYIRIPMFGFTESYNISVSVALTLYEVMGRLRESGININLSETEGELILLDWLRLSVKSSKLIEQRFLNDLNLSILY